jgi:hypothetical protein
VAGSHTGFEAWTPTRHPTDEQESIMTAPLTTDRHAVTGTRLTQKPSRDKRATAFEVRYAGKWLKVWTRTREGDSPELGIKSLGAFLPLDSDTVARLAVHRARTGAFVSINDDVVTHARRAVNR